MLVLRVDVMGRKKKGRRTRRFEVYKQMSKTTTQDGFEENNVAVLGSWNRGFVSVDCSSRRALLEQRDVVRDRLFSLCSKKLETSVQEPGHILLEVDASHHKARGFLKLLKVLSQHLDLELGVLWAP